MPTRFPSLGLQHRLSSLSAQARDVLLILAGCVVTYVFAVATDAFELLIDFAAEHEEWQLDEVLVMLMISAFGLLAYGYRRLQELQRETTRREAAERDARHQALHDPLTGLPNRFLLAQHLDQALANARRNGESVAVMRLDLDRFKEVNDSLGHAAGDALLRILAERLRGALREEDTIARVGGDEFVVLQRGLQQPSGAAGLASRLIAAVSEPYDLPHGARAACGVSIGVAVSPADGDQPDILLQAADSALYLAKSEGRGAARFFEKGMDAALRERQELSAALRIATASGDFLVHYQPLCALPEKRLVGFEALVRWQHPSRGMVPPAEFIPIAEETGLIIGIGEWVLRTACIEAASWPGEIGVAVNLSPIQFRRGDLLATVQAALSESGLDPRRLELEVTEGLLLQNSAATLTVLGQLRAMGVRIAMDDFGTGYSSLNTLWRFPFDKVKIDASFVRGMMQDEKAAAIVETVLGLGRTLGLAVTAEGVETAAQAEALGRAGCDQGQGFLLGRAMPAVEARHLIGQTASTLAEAP
ncbi:putative bifunctional diguanylate cyclase/phosphodiesterase [Roseomonas sp. BN140053]|uniref:putative bifunctional diguanylate cyclase/phosphodiesterase n=1 Tax=Roseomonas sp. BN140053 TaxID=3391898 RepID=UPI0039EC762D